MYRGRFWASCISAELPFTITLSDRKGGFGEGGGFGTKQRCLFFVPKDIHNDTARYPTGDNPTRPALVGVLGVRPPRYTPPRYTSLHDVSSSGWCHSSVCFYSMSTQFLFLPSALITTKATGTSMSMQLTNGYRK